MSLTTVPNITIGPPVVTCLRKAVPRSRAFFDCHMMVSNPDQWVDVFAEAGAGLSLQVPPQPFHSRIDVAFCFLRISAYLRFETFAND